MLYSPIIANTPWTKYNVLNLLFGWSPGYLGGQFWEVDRNTEKHVTNFVQP